MLYPDPHQRIVLGWQIRWVAGLFSLLMVVAGAIPAHSADRMDPFHDSENGALFATDDEEQATSGDLNPAKHELLLGSKTGAESEVEETAEPDASPASASPRLRLGTCDSTRVVQRVDRSAGQIYASGRLSPRAPPSL